MNNHEEYLKVKWPDYQDYQDYADREGETSFMEASTESNAIFIEKQWYERATTAIRRKKMLAQPGVFHFKCAPSIEAGLVPDTIEGQYKLISNGYTSVIARGSLIEGFSISGGPTLNVGDTLPFTDIKIVHIMQIDKDIIVVTDK